MARAQGVLIIASAPYHHGDVAAQSVAAALDLVRRGGEGSVSLRKVAERVGVTHRAVAARFGGRDALVRAVAARAYQALLAAVAGQPDRTAFARAYLRFALTEPRLYDVAMSRTDERRDDADLRAAALSVVEAARAAGCGDDADIKRLWMILHGGLALHRAGGLQPRSDEDLIAFMLEMADA